MTVDLLIILFIARYLRISLKTAEKHPLWDERLRWAFFGAIVLFVISVVYSPSQSLLLWAAKLGLATLAYLLYTQPVFKPARPVFIGISPYITISLFASLIKVVNHSLYDEWKDFIDTAEVCAVLWGIGTWIVVNKQNKELNTVREKVVQEEENSRIATAMKAQLEVQVAERTAELTTQKEALEHTLQELKATQAQLIQSEKMASLGELTAGIAHEIQNPLNFVNNFSEVSNELLEEMKTELNAGNDEEAIAIANDVKQNMEKIIFHGKRADAIVKGMLQHSRKNTGQKEEVNLNSLCDEYLRLSFHGLRAKDKAFNANFQTRFDESIGRINVVPQDIGRVLLNLINNAFYAVSERKKMAGEGYSPTVTITTKRINLPSGQEGVEIVVADNGTGIPAENVNKIFQPFFSTKPTGQGTGLGLSISYDIVTKQHGGTIQIQTKEDEGTSFIIQLPCR
ncbi:histidine kinase [Ilyomonas limi]|uniref:histidine kinase n=1 Tax=Ilyomonas limi TaxID=2575867 RepID=A0A4U3KYP0_9BACT|nr:ATP-binding protein [Ilyomonas limi]TKK67502.1 histidine kinase [Ilyomonas limi]